MTASRAYATSGPTAKLAPTKIERREPGDHDIAIDIAYCGICHSDIHSARNEWGGANYPMVPGHEIVGKVTKVGKAVKGWKVGDLAGVGCMVNSCGQCASCKADMEQFCEKGAIFTYNSKDRDGTITFGGYADSVVVDEKFVLRVSDKLPLDRVAPLLCAGITTYSPLKHWGVGKGKTVGVVGLGGLGHMGVKLARAMDAHVVVFTTSPGKKDDALRLGAHEVVVSKDDAAMKAQKGRFDFILDTVSAQHDLNALIANLRIDGTLCLVGAPPEALPVAAFGLIFGRKSLAGSLIGGIKETQEMLDFCAKHEVASDVEVIGFDKVNEAYDRTVKGDVKYRFVLDIATLGGA